MKTKVLHVMAILLTLCPAVHTAEQAFISPDYLIRPRQVGRLSTGMTVKDISRAYPSKQLDKKRAKEKSPIISVSNPLAAQGILPDFEAHLDKPKGNIRFFIVHVPGYKTPEGIAVGTSYKILHKVYKHLTISSTTSPDGMLLFADLPDRTIRFRLSCTPQAIQKVQSKVKPLKPIEPKWVDASCLVSGIAVW